MTMMVMIKNDYGDFHVVVEDEMLMMTTMMIMLMTELMNNNNNNNDKYVNADVFNAMMTWLVRMTKMLIRMLM